MPAIFRPAIFRARSAAVLPLMLVAVLTVGMFALAPSASAMTRSHRIGIGMDIVANQKGDPYRYGADGPGAFDCSGLVYYSFRKAGFRNIPRSSSAQARHMNRIKRSQMRRGDFVFFYSGAARAANVYHIAVFAGWSNGRRVIVHSPYSGQRVHRERIWTSHWFPGTLRGL